MGVFRDRSVPGGYEPAALIKEQEVILYFQRDGVDDPWYMKLEDSLRQLSPDSTKQN